MVCPCSGALLETKGRRILFLIRGNHADYALTLAIICTQRYTVHQLVYWHGRGDGYRATRCTPLPLPRQRAWRLLTGQGQQARAHCQYSRSANSLCLSWLGPLQGGVQLDSGERQALPRSSYARNRRLLLLSTANMLGKKKQGGVGVARHFERHSPQAAKALEAWRPTVIVAMHISCFFLGSAWGFIVSALRPWRCLCTVRDYQG